jgi:hypothetical protein
MSRRALAAPLLIDFAIGVLSLSPAAAAPFCVQVEGIPKQCMYVDPHDCALRARQLGGSCVANADSFPARAGPFQYCVVDSSLIPLCIFPDVVSCGVDAERRHGACIQSEPPPVPAAQPAPGHDPFSTVRPW